MKVNGLRRRLFAIELLLASVSFVVSFAPLVLRRIDKLLLDRHAAAPRCSRRHTLHAQLTADGVDAVTMVTVGHALQPSHWLFGGASRLQMFLRTVRKRRCRHLCMPLRTASSSLRCQVVFGAVRWTVCGVRVMPPRDRRRCLAGINAEAADVRMYKEVLLELFLAVEAPTAERAVEGSLVDHLVLDEVRPSGESLVADGADVGSVAEVEVLVLEEYVLVAEASVADAALVGLLADVGQSDVTDQSVLVAELFGADTALVRPALRRRSFRQRQQLRRGDLGRRRRRRDGLRALQVPRVRLHRRGFEYGGCR